MGRWVTFIALGKTEFFTNEIVFLTNPWNLCWEMVESLAKELLMMGKTRFSDEWLKFTLGKAKLHKSAAIAWIFYKWLKIALKNGESFHEWALHHKKNLVSSQMTEICAGKTVNPWRMSLKGLNVLTSSWNLHWEKTQNFTKVLGKHDFFPNSSSLHWEKVKYLTNVLFMLGKIWFSHKWLKLAMGKRKSFTNEL